MRPWLKLIIIIALGCWFALPSRAYAQPTIVFEEETHDFGEVSQSDKLEYTFVFQNVGNETLIIQKVTSS